MVLKVKCCQYLLLKTVYPSTDDCCSTVYTYSSVFSLTGVYILARAGDKVDMCRDPCLYVRYTILVSENIITSYYFQELGILTTPSSASRTQLAKNQLPVTTTDKGGYVTQYLHTL